MNRPSWDFKPVSEEMDQDADSLSDALGLSKFLTTLLAQRGITSYDTARDFFRPRLEQTHSPFLMKGMETAVQRLTDALANQEKILVYGDYDVDGSTAVAMFYDFLRKVHPSPTLVDYYIPDRYTEGYGISWTGIDWAEANRYTLIVSLDCGIKSADKVAAAKERGIDFIICDHHLPGEEIPAAVAVLDPKQTDCAYPFKELTGCGVGFKLLTALSERLGFGTDHVDEYLDLVTVSIACDIVPITDENRILSFYGLQKLNSSPRTGLKCLMEQAAVRPPVDITSIVFGLGPRINAAGRIKHAKEAVNLLLVDDAEMGKKYAQEIEIHNTTRRTFDSNITEEALAMIRQNEDSSNSYSTVLFKNDWNKGVIGIVASRCIEHFHRPTIILTEYEGKAMGSARSVPGFDIYGAIEECADLLEQFGGHNFAAGISLPVVNVERFRTRFEQVVQRRILPQQLEPAVLIDLNLPLEEIDWAEGRSKFYNVMRQMGPFGPGNMTPVFCSTNVLLTRPPKLLKDKHLKLELKKGTSNIFSAIGFGMGHLNEGLKMDVPFSICYTLEQNNFRGTASLQLMLKDIRA